MMDEKTEGQTKEILKTGPPFLMSRKGDRDERQNGSHGGKSCR
jgi:hypothetical protein